MSKSTVALRLWYVVACVLVTSLSGCKAPTPPDAEVRVTMYDLLPQVRTLGVPATLLAAVSDSIRLKLDSVEVIGLDNAISAWITVTAGAKITQVRHHVASTSQDKEIITDSGTVNFTFYNPDTKQGRDSVLVFIAKWGLRPNGWRYEYEQITRK